MNHLNKEQLFSIDHAANLLRSGELVAIPTETVYGLAANAFNEDAVRKIYETKGRPSNNPLIVHIKSADELDKVACEIPALARRMAHEFWPGPLTLILNKRDYISDVVSANYPTVAVRVPNHPVTLELLKRLDFPLVAPSANRTNHISPTKPEHVRNSLGKNTPFILEGGSCHEGLESTIIGFQGEDVVLHRQGTLALETLEKFIGKKLIIKSEEQKQTISPGTSKKHYAPKTPMILVDEEIRPEHYENQKAGFLTLKPLEFSHENHHNVALSDSGNLQEAVSNLYSALYTLDAMNLDCIVAELMPNLGLGLAINDRLKRAAAE
jgi:L-threonylcarbamoyladenylate synthase